MKLIPLNKGLFAKVDDQDFDRLSNYHWYATSSPVSRTYYALGRLPRGRKAILMHRLVKPCSENLDYIDRDGLNNQSSNLRTATAGQNSANSGLARNNTSGARGVIWDIHKKKWQARYKHRGKTLHLGRFDCLQAAAIAYNNKAKELYGDYAFQNPIDAQHLTP